MEEKILICDCSSTEHQIILRYDEDDNECYASIHLTNLRGFFSRLKYGLKYIFGYKCRYGAWDEFIFKKEHIGKLRELADLIEKSAI